MLHDKADFVLVKTIAVRVVSAATTKGPRSVRSRRPQLRRFSDHQTWRLFPAHGDPDLSSGGPQPANYFICGAKLCHQQAFIQLVPASPPEPASAADQ